MFENVLFGLLVFLAIGAAILVVYDAKKDSN